MPWTLKCGNCEKTYEPPPDAPVWQCPHCGDVYGKPIDRDRPV